MSNSLRPYGLKHAKVYVPCISDAIQPSHPLTPSSPSAPNLSQHQGLHQCVICSHQMTLPMCHLFTSDDWSFSISICPSSGYSGLISLKIDWFDLLAVQRILKSPPTPQFKSTNSSALSLLYGPTLKPVRDHWEDQSLDYTDLCQQSNVSAFQHTV